MSGIVLVERGPIFLLRRTGQTTPEETRSALDHLATLLAKNKKTAFVWDAPRAAGRPDAATRATASEWIKNNNVILHRLRVDFSLPSPLSRGILTAVHWTHKPRYDYAIHSNCADAVRAACEHVGMAEQASELLQQLDKASREREAARVA